jgi:hypothetical protein
MLSSLDFLAVRAGECQSAPHDIGDAGAAGKGLLAEKMAVGAAFCQIHSSLLIQPGEALNPY